MRSGADLSRVSGEVERLLTLFREAGALRVDPDALLPADILLDLYGEDIRARAFVTQDDERELMLRPDFTVPVVHRHMAQGSEPARYAYAGPVWRRQQAGADRATEYLQAGFELFDGSDRAAADAEVFALMSRALDGLGLRAAIGDMGLLIAAIDALETSAARKAALRRHLWRPRRFQRLLDRYAAVQPLREVLAGPESAEELVATSGRALGLRSGAEVAARVHRLRAEAKTPALKPEDLSMVEGLLQLSTPAAMAADEVSRIIAARPAMQPALDRLRARTAALEARGVPVDTLAFEGAFGRTTLEYYDGFVFGFYAPDRPDLPTIASGGRYDALTAVLGAGNGVPAVGGIIRPQAVLALQGAVS